MSGINTRVRFYESTKEGKLIEQVFEPIKKIENKKLFQEDKSWNRLK